MARARTRVFLPPLSFESTLVDAHCAATLCFYLFLIRPLGAGGARDPEGARLAPKINDLSDFVPAVRHTLRTCVSSKSHMLTYAAGKGGKKEGGGEGKEGAGGVGRGTAGGGHWMVSDDDEDDDADDDDGSMILIRKLQQGVYHS